MSTHPNQLQGPGYVARALDAIRLAGAEYPGGIGGMAKAVGVNASTARRLVRAPVPAIQDIERLELLALQVLGRRAPVAGPTDPARAGLQGEDHGR